MLQPMLAGTLKNLNALRYPILASPKLDGVRAIGTPQGLMSRSGKLIPNRHVQMLFGKSCEAGFDGELIVGEPTDPACYRTTMSGVMREDGEPPVTYYVFDTLAAGERVTFKPRLDYAKRYGKNIPCVRVLHHILIRAEEELLRYEEVCLGKGYEGVMIRDPAGPYKHGRSTEREGWLLKLKRFADSEARIVGAVELCHNMNPAKTNAMGHTERSSHKASKFGAGMLGALQVVDLQTGMDFDIGTGFGEALRKELWVQHAQGQLVDRIVSYKYFPTGSKDRPRFPVFKGFRDPRDL
jgi:DNA ligase-1